MLAQDGSGLLHERVTVCHEILQQSPCPTSHLVTMLKANHGFPAFGWEAGTRFDFEKPGYR